MMRSFLIPLLAGVIGAAILASLGFWQLQRLAWKEAVLAEIEARIVAVPVAVPEAPNVEADRYLPVRASGRTTGEEALVLVSVKGAGAGYRVISVFETENRRLLLDEGYIRSSEQGAARPPVELTVTGNLHWPDEVDGFTPDPDLEEGLWFARDVPALAAELGTEPVFIIARSITGTDPRATPFPVTSEGVPNNHLGYAVQWFGMAIVWVGMTVFLLWRIRKRTL